MLSDTSAKWLIKMFPPVLPLFLEDEKGAVNVFRVGVKGLG